MLQCIVQVTCVKTIKEILLSTLRSFFHRRECEQYATQRWAVKGTLGHNSLEIVDFQVLIVCFNGHLAFLTRLSVFFFCRISSFSGSLRLL